VVRSPTRPRRLGSRATYGRGAVLRCDGTTVLMTTLTTIAGAPAPSMFTVSAGFWQSAAQGRAAVATAVSWWDDYGRADGHRLFTANDRETAGIARLSSAVQDIQSGCRTMRSGNNG
jgi:hypothetical protein